MASYFQRSARRKEAVLHQSSLIETSLGCLKHLSAAFRRQGTSQTWSVTSGKFSNNLIYECVGSRRDTFVRGDTSEIWLVGCRICRCCCHCWKRRCSTCRCQMRHPWLHIRTIQIKPLSVRPDSLDASPPIDEPAEECTLSGHTLTARAKALHLSEKGERCFEVKL